MSLIPLASRLERTDVFFSPSAPELISKCLHSLPLTFQVVIFSVVIELNTDHAFPCSPHVGSMWRIEFPSTAILMEVFQKISLVFFCWLHVQFLTSSDKIGFSVRSELFCWSSHSEKPLQSIDNWQLWPDGRNTQQQNSGESPEGGFLLISAAVRGR